MTVIRGPSFSTLITPASASRNLGSTSSSTVKTTRLPRPSPRIKVARRIEGDDPAAVDDENPVAEGLRFLHVMGGQKDSFAPVPDPPDELPHGPAGVRVEPRRQLVQEDELGIVDQGQGDEQSLLLPAGELGERRLPLFGEAQGVEEQFPVRRLPVERREEVKSLPDLDVVGKGALLELDADALPERAPVAPGIEPQDREAARSAERIPSRHSIVVVFPAPFGPTIPKTSFSRTSKLMPSTAVRSP